jgi:hypothetical protein
MRRRWVPGAPAEVPEPEPTASRVAIKQELPPDQIGVYIETPYGKAARWADDEPGAADTMADLVLGDEMPGGCQSMGGTLGRNPQINWGDIVAFSKAYAYGPGGEKLWEGYFDKAPEASGDRMSITPALVGNQKHLEGNKAIKLGIIDSDLSKWGDPSTQRRKNVAAANIIYQGEASVGFQGTGAALPGVVHHFDRIAATAGSGPFALVESFYYGDGVPLGALLYNFNFMAGGGANEFWDNLAVLSDDDLDSATDIHADYNGVSASEQSIFATTESRKYAHLYTLWKGTSTNDGDWTAIWEVPKVLGPHGMTPSGIWPNIGYTAKQILAYSIPKFASPLQINPNYLDDDDYIIPQAWYPDTNMGEVVRDVTKYGLYDWFVYFDHLFQNRVPGSYGRFWKAYVGESNLEELGEDSERLWESIVVSYSDVDGIVRTAGPPDSGAYTEDARLRITDPDHPAVRAELTRRDILDLRGIGTPETAVAVGVRFLEEATLLSRSGSATLSGYVLDDKGNLRPASHVRSGDWVSFVDAADPSYRKIVQKNYTHASRGADIDVDAPPSGLEALLERLQAVLIGSGVE